MRMSPGHLCDLGMGFPEFGTVRISELESFRGEFGLGIERDLAFRGQGADLPLHRRRQPGWLHRGRGDAMIRRRLSALRWRIRHRCLRLKRAFCYATGRLSFEDANEIMRDCERSARSYPSMVLTPQRRARHGDRALWRRGNSARTLSRRCLRLCRPKMGPACGDYWHPRSWALAPPSRPPPKTASHSPHLTSHRRTNPSVPPNEPAPARGISSRDASVRRSQGGQHAALGTLRSAATRCGRLPPLVDRDQGTRRRPLPRGSIPLRQPALLCALRGAVTDADALIDYRYD